MDHEEFRQAGYKVIDEIVEYYKTTSQLKRKYFNIIRK
jgi:hypothetical protein